MSAIKDPKFSSNDDNFYYELGMIEKDIENHQRLIEKMDTALDRLGQISSDVSKMLALHDQRLDMLNRDQINTLAKIKLSNDNTIDLANKLENQIKALEVEIKEYAEKDNVAHTELSRKIHNIMNVANIPDPKQDGLEKTVAWLQRWQWLVVGGAITFIWLVTSVDLVALSALFH